AERMSSLGAKGIEIMSAALNTYFDKLIRIVHNYGGDVIKFAGDAVLACWPTSLTSDQMGRMVVLTCQCALAIQEELAEYEVQGCPLQLHVGVGAGKISFIHVGG